MAELILYTAEDARTRIQLRAADGTVWLTQAEMAELFDVSTDSIGLHLKNIYADGELEPERTTEDSSVVGLVRGMYGRNTGRLILLPMTH